MNNRRNFYRILHVQPEAPLEIIKASYRSLMTKLKMHPDLGGDHETAVLINQAYVVLSDPKKRRQYDEMRQTCKSPGRRYQAYEAPINTYEPSGFQRPSEHRTGGNDDEPRPDTAQRRCLFCGTVFFLAPKTNRYCSQCASPLVLAQPVPNKRLREIFGRRKTPRVARMGALIIYPNWPHAGYSAQLRDLSPFGISMLTKYSARTGQVLKFDSVNLKGIAHVVSVRENGTDFSVRASFLTVEFLTKVGAFVTEKV
jgi:hypothetical protein